jgi:glutamyl-tRNA synthetase
VSVRVRFAPSPTGTLHLGSAMTAVANYLFASRAGGAFVLRVDDTDALRSERRFERSVIQDAEWLGLRFDEGPGIGGAYGPYRQSERAALYADAGVELLARGGAYRCFCSELELEHARSRAEQQGRPFRYDRRCAAIDPAEAVRRAASGEPHVVRLHATSGPIEIHDAARGTVVIPDGAIDDLVLLRSDGSATYNFATAVDDAAMDITHVIRGEDHIANTAAQLAILRALGRREPRYAHCALLLDQHGHKLSKRTGAESIADLRADGYPPEAIVNYVALLVCPAPEGVDEVASLAALAARFSLSTLSSGQQRFDRAKLDYLSRRHLERLDPLDLASRVGRVLELRGVGFHPAQLTALSEGLRGSHTLSEAADEAEQILKRRTPVEQPGEETRAVLRLFCRGRSGWHEPYLAPSEAEELLRDVAEQARELGLARGTVLHALRVALTGAEHGVGMHYVVAAIERGDALARSGCEDGR